MKIINSSFLHSTANSRFSKKKLQAQVLQNNTQTRSSKAAYGGSVNSGASSQSALIDNPQIIYFNKVKGLVEKGELSLDQTGNLQYPPEIVDTLFKLIDKIPSNEIGALTELETTVHDLSNHQSFNEDDIPKSIPLKDITMSTVTSHLNKIIGKLNANVNGFQLITQCPEIDLMARYPDQFNLIFGGNSLIELLEDESIGDLLSGFMDIDTAIKGTRSAATLMDNELTQTVEGFPRTSDLLDKYKGLLPDTNYKYFKSRIEDSKQKACATQQSAKKALAKLAQELEAIKQQRQAQPTTGSSTNNHSTPNQQVTNTSALPRPLEVHRGSTKPERGGTSALPASRDARPTQQMNPVTAMTSTSFHQHQKSQSTPVSTPKVSAQVQTNPNGSSSQGNRAQESQ